MLSLQVTDRAFGDARSDIISILSVFMGTAKAQAFMASLEKQIQEQAGKGAEAKVKPWLYAALGLGAAGTLIALISLARR